MNYIASDGTFQIRFDTASSWSSANPILEKGELAIESDTNKIKCGDGVKNWNALSYIGGSGYTKSEIDQKVADINSSIASQSYVPVGSVYYFATNTAPNGYLVCNGNAISRTTYKALFDLIGTTYGAGDGSTTFNLPNLIDNFIQGSATVGTIKQAGLPNIIGTLADIRTSDGADASASGSLSFTSTTKYPNTVASKTGRTYYDGITLDASSSSAIYGNSETVQPPALTLLPCIKV